MKIEMYNSHSLELHRHRCYIGAPNRPHCATHRSCRRMADTCPSTRHEIDCCPSWWARRMPRNSYPKSLAWFVSLGWAHNRWPGTSILPNCEHCVACPNSSWLSSDCHWRPTRAPAFPANAPAVQFERQSNRCHRLHLLFANARTLHRYSGMLTPIPNVRSPLVLHVRSHTVWPMCKRSKHNQRHSMPNRLQLGNYSPNKCAICIAISICRRPFVRPGVSLSKKKIEKRLEIRVNWNQIVKD